MTGIRPTSWSDIERIGDLRGRIGRRRTGGWRNKSQSGEHGMVSARSRRILRQALVVANAVPAQRATVRFGCCRAADSIAGWASIREVRRTCVQGTERRSHRKNQGKTNDLIKIYAPLYGRVRRTRVEDSALAGSDLESRNIMKDTRSGSLTWHLAPCWSLSSDDFLMSARIKRLSFDLIECVLPKYNLLMDAMLRRNMKAMGSSLVRLSAPVSQFFLKILEYAFEGKLCSYQWGPRWCDCLRLHRI